MPTFTVRLKINVPGLGTREENMLNLIAPTIESAIAQAKALVTVEALAATKTAD